MKNFNKLKTSEFWNTCKYPLTVIKDRYGGVYSGALYTAFPLYYYLIPEEADGDDVSCCTFWSTYPHEVGKGMTAQLAIDDLIRKVNKRDEQNK